jgi:hypothetical protein
MTHLNKRNAIQRAIRIYGSQSWWGDGPRWTPPDSPFESADFPGPGDRIQVHLGSVPGEIAEQIRDRGALANAYLDRTFGGRSASISVASAGQREREAIPAFDSEEWYVTVVFDRPLELEENPDPPGPELWWAPDPAEAADASFRKMAPGVLDAIAARVATSLGSEYFEVRAIDRDFFLLLGEERPLSFVPRMLGSARGAVGRGSEQFPADLLAERVTDLGEGDARTQRWLRTPIGRYASALAEPDSWRAFSSLWMAVETLARKVSVSYRDEVLSKLAELGHLPGAVKEIDRVDWSTPGSPIAADFAILAVLLDPAGAEADRRVFADAKKVRDRLNHGSMSVDQIDAELPVGPLRTLAENYLRLALLRRLGGAPDGSSS